MLCDSGFPINDMFGSDSFLLLRCGLVIEWSSSVFYLLLLYVLNLLLWLSTVNLESGHNLSILYQHSPHEISYLALPKKWFAHEPSWLGSKITTPLTMILVQFLGTTPLACPRRRPRPRYRVLPTPSHSAIVFTLLHMNSAEKQRVYCNIDRHVRLFNSPPGSGVPRMEPCLSWKELQACQRNRHSPRSATNRSYLHVVPSLRVTRLGYAWSLASKGHSSALDNVCLSRLVLPRQGGDSFASINFCCAWKTRSGFSWECWGHESQLHRESMSYRGLWCINSSSL